MHRCCFTGHRPEKLHSSESLVKNALAREIWTAYQEGFRTFLTGMARGTDIWSGELILRTCPHKRLSRVEMLEILTIDSWEETEIS